MDISIEQTFLDQLTGSPHSKIDKLMDLLTSVATNPAYNLSAQMRFRLEWKTHALGCSTSGGPG